MIVEDGTQVTNSDTYVSRADYIAYALTLGITVPDTVVSDNQLIKAAEYIDQHEGNLIGNRFTRDQAMAFPRSDLYIEGYYWTTTEIPRQLVSCQLAFALDIKDGDDLYNRSNNPNTPVKKEKIDGAVEVEYAVKETNQGSKVSKGDILLEPLLRDTGTIITLVRA